ncbi:MAG: NfeD family protein [Clostridia bacterium]|nr:NfeD family protein [Clostridia bacterium]
MVYVWIGVIVAAIVLEMLTDQLIAVWFMPSAIVCAILDLCGVPMPWQLLVFLLVSVAGIVLSRTLLKKWLRFTKTATNVEAVVGEKCVVTERIDNYAGCGQAKVRGQIWSARSIDDDETFEAGEILRIVAVEGVRIICKKNT